VRIPIIISLVATIGLFAWYVLPTLLWNALVYGY
jgi:hypothetical protein